MSFEQNPQFTWESGVKGSCEYSVVEPTVEFSSMPVMWLFSQAMGLFSMKPRV